MLHGSASLDACGFFLEYFDPQSWTVFCPAAEFAVCLGRGAGIITLTGWVALAALVSLVIVVVGSIVLAYRRWAGLDKPQVVVTKQGDV